MASSAVQLFRKLWESPVGIRTTHFWGPVANWGIVLAGIADVNLPADKLSLNMTVTLCVYSLVFMRFAWMVRPRNYLLLACHASNETVQLYTLYRIVKHKLDKPDDMPSLDAIQQQIQTQLQQEKDGKE